MKKVARAVLFDLDDTLFDHRHSARCALAEWQAHNARLQNYTLELLEQEDLRLLEEKHALVLAGLLSAEDARVQRVQALFRYCGEDIDIERAKKLASLRVEIYRKSRRAVPGAESLLAEVKRYARIGVITNNFTAEQKDKIECCALQPFIDLLVTSEDTGFTKPSIEIFHIAVNRLACEPDEVVMIGDSWDIDIVGAIDAGLRAIWFNRYRMPNRDLSQSQIPEIHSLEPAADVASRVLYPY